VGSPHPSTWPQPLLLPVPSDPAPLSRRHFLRSGSAVLAGAPLLSGAGLASPRSAEDPAPVRPRGDEELRIGLVGCGGRGAGAAVQALSTEGPVRLVAMADAFSDRLEGALSQIRQSLPDRVDVPEERRFVGFDAYRELCALELDLVILATPPGFRPMHFAHAVERGLHVFMEKPVAVDGPGVRQVLAAAAEAKRRGLNVGVGLQRHHDARYLETVDRIHQGAIGEVVLLRSYWNSAGVWTRPREAGQGEMEYQMRNWYYFNWLCGDHIVEQHIHNLDVANWVMNDYPVEAQGQGGRQVRTDTDHGEIYDHHMVEFTYASGAKLLSQCRHIPGTWSSVSEHVHGTRGTANVGAGRIDGPGGWSWRWRGDVPNPYQVEHDRLFAAIREGRPHHEAENGAMATMTAILGRMATYSGQVIKMQDALASELALVPSAYSFEGTPPTVPDADGRYPIPTPGKTRAY
jgi:myo-inositol 2-dehydrogenase/D-chiro-inositol 1-dehydrogenase